MAHDRTHCGPSEAKCAACGQAIGAYESRWYGPTGAAHAFDPSRYGAPGMRECKPFRSVGTDSIYPHYYTDG